MTALQLCKLTDQNLRTHNEFQWVLNEPAPILCGTGGLCSPTVYHCYEHPLLAALLNPIHGDIKKPRIFRVEIPAPYDAEPLLDSGLKRGYRTMTLKEELEMPSLTKEIGTAFAILCALKVYAEPTFKNWAENWLNGEDRSADAADAVYAAARSAADAAADAAAADAADAALHAAYAPYAANAAAYAAANAANAAHAAKPINLIEIAEKALNY